MQSIIGQLNVPCCIDYLAFYKVNSRIRINV